MLENIDLNSSLFEPSVIVAAVITVVIVALFWKYVLGIGFITGYGVGEKRNVSLKEFLSKVKPAITLFVCEGCNLDSSNNAKLIQWINEAVQKGVQVKILLGPKSNMTFALKNSSNVTLYKLKEESEKGFILVENGPRNVTAFIQTKQEKQRIKNTSVAHLFPGPRKAFFEIFNELRKKAEIIEF